MATGINSSPTIREGLNLLRNWNPAFENTLRHVCQIDPKATGGIAAVSGAGMFNVKNIAEISRREQSIKEIKTSSRTEIEKSEEIVKAYETYLYNMNKSAFDDYWNIRRNFKGDRWDSKKYEEVKKIENQLGDRLQQSGINMKNVLQEMGDDILSVNSNTPYIPFVAGSKLIAKSQDNYQFYNLVNTNQPLDLKNRAYQENENQSYSIWSRDWGGGVKNDYAGNYLYGYVGKGYLQSTDAYLKSAAGVAQVWSDLNNKEVGAWSIINDIPNRSYLDNSGDSDMIQDGINDYKAKNRGR